jgi:hypothetical protein
VNKIVLLVLLPALVVAACGGDSATTDELPVDDGSGRTPAVGGACLEGEPDCNDTPGGEPTDLPPAGNDEPPLPSTIQVAAAAGASGPVAVAGFIVAAGDQIRICEALAESYPPQCGGASLPVTGLDQVDPDDLQTEGDVTWTDYAVTLYGEMVDGTLVVTPIE